MNPSPIQLKLFAGLAAFTPENADRVPIESGVSVEELIRQLNIPVEKAHLIFIDGIKCTLASRLKGGERVGIFPPVAGG
jgi:sulfur-carrier protein